MKIKDVDKKKKLQKLKIIFICKRKKKSFSSGINYKYWKNIFCVSKVSCRDQLIEKRNMQRFGDFCMVCFFYFFLGFLRDNENFRNKVDDDNQYLIFGFLCVKQRQIQLIGNVYIDNFSVIINCLCMDLIYK